MLISQCEKVASWREGGVLIVSVVVVQVHFRVAVTKIICFSLLLRSASFVNRIYKLEILEQKSSDSGHLDLQWNLQNGTELEWLKI